MLQRATAEAHAKPWGRSDLSPWSALRTATGPIGELWFLQPPAPRTAPPATEPALLLKLLFTGEPLSIQVHPDDACARTAGMPHGKSEAWYILSALPGAAVALGLLAPLAPAALRAAVEDGSIEARVRWQRVSAGDAWYVAPGTIHSLGAGLVLLEVQQRSDATYRLFDFGRHRALHAEAAMGAASASQEAPQSPRRRLDDQRTLLVASPHFVLELLELQAGTTWELDTMTETWAFVLEGQAALGPLVATSGDAFYVDAESTYVEVAALPWRCLVAYVGAQPASGLLRVRPQARA